MTRVELDCFIDIVERRAQFAALGIKERAIGVIERLGRRLLDARIEVGERLV
ncbi:MAG: hypothetical protein IIU43_03530 [Thermoguttaceae bacterium]|nr:hypothetical protein [Thermoguttaceae bacterium]